MNTTEKEFFDAIGLEQIISYKPIKQQQQNILFPYKHYPKITVEIRERLEEMIFIQLNSMWKTLLAGPYLVIGKSKIFIYQIWDNKKIIADSYCETRSDALLSLMTKLVKQGIIEGSKVLEVFE